MVYKAEFDSHTITFHPCDFGKDAFFSCEVKRIAETLTEELRRNVDVFGLGPSLPSVPDYAKGVLEDFGAVIKNWPVEDGVVVY